VILKIDKMLGLGLKLLFWVIYGYYFDTIDYFDYTVKLIVKQNC